MSKKQVAQKPMRKVAPKISLAKEPVVDVTSSQVVSTQEEPVITSASTSAVGVVPMSLTLVRSNAARKSQRLVIYNIQGRRGSVQFLSTLFGGDQDSQGNPPETLVIEGQFAPVKERIAREKESPEQRKARLAALPKLTLAEKVARQEEKTAKMKAKLVAQQTRAAAALAATQPAEMATV